MTSTFYTTIIPLVRAKTVLDVGSIGHTYTGRTGYKTWNFAVLAQHAAKIRGFDLLSADIEEARADGWDIEVGNAESYIASDTYDVVFAGDLIEHLSNPGQFLECSHRNLNENGKLVLSTPNTYSFAKMARVAARRTNEPPVNPEHTCYYTPRTLTHLASRHGFRLVEVKYCELDYAEGHGTWSKRTQLAINAKLSSWLPQFSQTMVLIFEKAPSGASSAD